jgi:hypothetical protein
MRLPHPTKSVQSIQNRNFRAGLPYFWERLESEARLVAGAPGCFFIEEDTCQDWLSKSRASGSEEGC